MDLKGQAATEYLIMFALVVIIALIVAGALGGFPQLGGAVGERESAAYWSSANIGIIAHHISTDSSKTRITFRNNNNFPIRLERADFGYQNLNIGRVLSPGSNVEVNGTNVVSCLGAGDRYYLNVTIYYTDTQSGSLLSFTGERPLVGICQAG